MEKYYPNNNNTPLDKVYQTQIDSTKNQVNEVLKLMDRNLNYEKITNSFVTQLKEYLKESKQDGYVIGISGGIDSALVSTLCAMTGVKTICLELPIHQKQDEITRANKHINWLKERFENIYSYSN